MSSELVKHWIEKSDFKRTVYAKNTLAEVIFQVQFGRLLKIDATPPIDFQELVQARFPLLEVEEAFAFNPRGEVLVAPSKTYKFYSLSKDSFVSLASNFVAVSVLNSYQEWPEFKTLIGLALDAAWEVYHPATVTRIGLRYRNVIDRNLLKTDLAWSSLLNRESLGFIADPQCEAHTLGAHSTVNFQIGDSKLTVYSGLVTNDKKQKAFLLDADYFNDVAKPNDRDNIIEIADDLNACSGPFFRWCITDALHDILQRP